MRTEPPEDCDRQCKSQSPPFECCGGCPMQCACRLETEADMIASREEIYEQTYYGEDDY